MENKPKKINPDPLIIQNLCSKDETVVLKTIRRLRSGSNIQYIPELLKLLNNSGKEVIENELVSLLADVKNPAAMPLIIKGLKDPELSSARGNIVSACWQSGMDYSHELNLFVRVFLEGNYQTALECFTVIEESVININREDFVKIRSEMIKELKLVSKEKKPLASELLKLIEELNQ